MLMNIGYKKLNPFLLMSTPYVIPKKIKPVKIGTVYGNAAFSAAACFFSEFIMLFLLTVHNDNTLILRFGCI